MALRDGSIQKAFWLRNGLADRLDRVIRERRKADKSFSERRALGLAVKSFVEHEEKALGVAAPNHDDLLEQLDETIAKLRALRASGA